MPSKYILNREDFFQESSPELERLAEFFKQAVEPLSKMLETTQLSLPEDLTDAQLEKMRQFNIELSKYGFDLAETASLERVLYQQGISARSLFEESGYSIFPVVNQYYTINESGVLDVLKSLWNALTDNGSPLGILHLFLLITSLVLDLLGPETFGLGILAAEVVLGIDAIIYIFEGKYFDALLDCVAIVLPVAGQFIGQGLKTSKLFGQMSKVTETMVKTGKVEAEAIAKIGAQETKFLKVLGAGRAVAEFLGKCIRWIVSAVSWLLQKPPLKWIPGLSSLGKTLDNWIGSSVNPIIKNIEKASVDYEKLALPGGPVSKLVKDAETGASTGVILGDTRYVVSKKGKVYRADSPQGQMILTAKTDITALDKFTADAYSKMLKGDALTVKEEEALFKVIGKNKFEFNPLSPTSLNLPADVVKGGEKAIADYIRTGVSDWKASVEALSSAGAFTEKEAAEILRLQTQLETAALGKVFGETVVKLDQLPAAVKELEIAVKGADSGSKLAADVITGMKGDKEVLGEFFRRCIESPQIRAQLGEKGIGLFARLSKNPELIGKFAASSKVGGEALMKLNSKLTRIGKKALAGRVMARRLTIMKVLIGAPIRCPFNSYKGEDDMGGIENLFSSKTKQIKDNSSNLKYISGRSSFLLEQDVNSGVLSTEEIMQSVRAKNTELEKTIEKQTAEKQSGVRGAWRLGPQSYVDVCNSLEVKLATQAAVTTSAIPTTPVTTAIDPAIDVQIKNADDYRKQCNTLGIGEGLMPVGVMTGVPVSSSPVTVAAVRIQEDVVGDGLWYKLGSVMGGEMTLNDSLYKELLTQLQVYENSYEQSKKSAEETGLVSVYPNPTEATWIKQELQKAKADPGYMPHFFGPGVEYDDIINKL